MRNIFLLFFVLVFAQHVKAQVSTPYSRYGLGILYDNNTAQSAQMGGLGAAFQSGETVNYLNPASYASLQFTSFDVGTTGSFGTTKTQFEKAKESSFALNYLSLFFPINKYWTSGVSLLPYSGKDYLIAQTYAYDSLNSVKFEYEGSGTLYNLSWGNGFKYKGIFLGFNVGYLFGKLNNNTLAYPLNQSGTYDQNAYTTWTFTDTKVSSFIWNAGAQYNLPIKSKADSLKVYNITFGLSGSAPINIGKNTYNDIGAYTFQSAYLAFRTPDMGINDFISDYIAPRTLTSDILDTLSEAFKVPVDIRLPATLNVGIVASRGIKFRAGVDFKFQPWSKYKGYEDNAASILNNSWRIAAGGEFLPNDKNFSKFFSRLKYRAGFSYTQTNLKINNKAINEFGINFGLGIPLLITTATDGGVLQKVYTYAFSIGLEAGSRGTTEENLVRQTFYRLKLGITLNDRWFVRRKYY